MAVVLLDTFSGTGDLTAHTSDSGATWAVGQSASALADPSAAYPLDGRLKATESIIGWVHPSVAAPTDAAFQVLLAFSNAFSVGGRPEYAIAVGAAMGSYAAVNLDGITVWLSPNADANLISVNLAVWDISAPGTPVLEELEILTAPKHPSTVDSVTHILSLRVEADRETITVTFNDASYSTVSPSPIPLTATQIGLRMHQTHANNRVHQLMLATVSAPTTGTDVFLDNFTGTGDLTAHTPDVGAAWALGPHDATVTDPTDSYPLMGDGRVGSNLDSTGGLILAGTPAPNDAEFEIRMDFEVADVAGIPNYWGVALADGYPDAWSGTTYGLFMNVYQNYSGESTGMKYELWDDELSNPTTIYMTRTLGAHSIALRVGADRRTVTPILDGIELTPLVRTVDIPSGATQVAFRVAPSTTNSSANRDGYVLKTQVLEVGAPPPPEGSTHEASGYQVAVGFGSPVLLSASAQTFGFSPTRFGYPEATLEGIAPIVVTQHAASGWRATQFGEPDADVEDMTPATQGGAASGFAATSFGTANGASTFDAAAEGFRATLFGSSTANVTVIGAAAGADLSPRFGVPRLPDSTTYVAAGFGPTTNFGAPQHLVPHVASGFELTAFGEPTLVEQQLGEAAGFVATQIGAPVAVHGFEAAGWAAGVAFGAPQALPAYRATGAATTAFGEPSAGMLMQATSLPVTTRFGAPSVAATSTNEASGFGGAQFGVPTANHFLKARSFAAPTRFGQPKLEI